MANTKNYSHGKIYTIRTHNYDKYYIGSTTQDLCKRLSKHKSSFALYQATNKHFISSYKLFQLGDCYIELLENFSCSSKIELNKREGELIRLHKPNLVNIAIAGRTKKEYNTDNKEIIKEYMKKYGQDNKIALSAYKKTYGINNKAKIKEYQRQKYLEKKKNNLLKLGIPSSTTCMANIIKGYTHYDVNYNDIEETFKQWYFGKWLLVRRYAIPY